MSDSHDRPDDMLLSKSGEKAEKRGKKGGKQKPNQTPKTEPKSEEDTAVTGKGGRKKNQSSGKPKRKTTLQLFIGFLIKIAVIVVATWVMLTFVLGLTIHYGNNMYPAIRDGDLVISLRVQKPYLNAAVLYKHNGKLCTGRVVGMPGMEINITDEGAIMVNGVTPAEEVFYPTHPSERGNISYPYTVAGNQVFILNDFRSDSNDSRSFGGVDLKDVKGPILLTIRRRGF